MSTIYSAQTAEEFARNLYVRLDSMEFAQVADQSFTEDVVLHFGELAPVHGREGFVQTVLTFTKHMKSINHDVTNVTAVGDLVMVALNVTYAFIDVEETISIRVFVVSTLRPSDANKICKYEVYADFTQVHQVLAKMEVE